LCCVQHFFKQKRDVGYGDEYRGLMGCFGGCLVEREDWQRREVVILVTDFISFSYEKGEKVCGGKETKSKLVR
jgi:hypothetical protein